MTNKLPLRAGENLTFLHDWAARLSRAEADLGLTAGTLTITAVVGVTAPTGVTAATPAVNPAATGVTFKGSTTLTAPQDIVLTTTVTLSNGDTDKADLTIGII